MAGRPRKPKEPVVVYDGSCGICEALKSYAEKHVVGEEVFHFVAHQEEDLAKRAPGVELEHAQQTLIVRLVDGTLIEGAAGVAWVMQKMTDPWNQIGQLLAVEPVTRIAQPVYRLVAKNRSRLSRFFGLTACPFPLKED